MAFREEVDSMGPVKVPEMLIMELRHQRAIENFPISGLTFQTVFIKAIALIKRHAAQVNQELGILPLDCQRHHTGGTGSN